MEWTDDQLIPISAISHHLYCPRQNALIHVEGIFLDNELTTAGNIGHEFVDEEKSINDHGLLKETSLRVYSDELGITGIADIVEFPENLSPFPIDYKHGKIAEWGNQEAQLCAIALCLEEMLDTSVPAGAIYHIHSKKRHEVNFTESLRNKTKYCIADIRTILVNRILPPVTENMKLCKRCSLSAYCLPGLKEVGSFHKIFIEGDDNV